MKLLKPYLPSLALVLVAVLQVLTVALDDNRLQLNEALSLVVALSTAVATYIIPNAAQGVASVLKPAVAVLGAVASALINFTVDGVDAQEITLVVIAALGALGVVAANDSAPKHVRLA